MFSIFTYIMSRVTHSQPGLPMTRHDICIHAFFSAVFPQREITRISPPSRPFTYKVLTVLGTQCMLPLHIVFLVSSLQDPLSRQDTFDAPTS